MAIDKVLFSVNEYDSDGDLIDTGIYLHFGNTKILAADNIKEFTEFIGNLQNMLSEIKENYQDRIK